MFAVICKTVNSKYFKNITEKTKQLGQKGLQAFNKPSSPKLYFNHLVFNQNLIKNQIKQQPVCCTSDQLHDLMFDYSFNPFEHIASQQQQIFSSSIPLQIIHHPNISINSIQSLQFQANNPIQDKLSHKKLTSINAQCISIFDGHGGNKLSQYASKKISQLIDEYLMSNIPKNVIKKGNSIQKEQKSIIINIIQESIQYAYKQIEQKFQQILEQQLKTGNKQIIKIGTCALTVIIWNDTILIANSGDSQAIIVTQDQNGLCYFKANQQLNTNNIQQIKRIQSEFLGIDEQVLVKSKLNHKIYIKGILQPTRTLGDYYLKKQKYFNKVNKASKTPFKGPYIKYNPQFKIIPIKSNFRHLIIASDGIWDFTTKKEVLKVIQQYNAQISQQQQGFSYQQLSKAYIQKPSNCQAKKLTECLRDHVLQKCAKKKNMTLQKLQSIPAGQRRNYCDDISIVTVDFYENTFLQ